MEIPEINLPDTDYILVPPNTIFYPPVAEIPYLDPVLLPSLEQVESGLGGQEASVEEEKESATEEGLQVTPESIPKNLPETKETLSSEEAIATFIIIHLFFHICDFFFKNLSKYFFKCFLDKS